MKKHKMKVGKYIQIFILKKGGCKPTNILLVIKTNIFSKNDRTKFLRQGEKKKTYLSLS